MKLINVTKKSQSYFVIYLLIVSLLLLQVPVPITIAQRQEGRVRVLTHTGVATLPGREKRWAVIIGVDKYKSENIIPLRGAGNDTRALAKALQLHAGFSSDNIVLMTSDAPEDCAKTGNYFRECQPTRANILTMLSNLQHLVPSDGLLLVSFSGHGMERERQAFLIPSDARYTEDIELLKDTAVSVEGVRKRIESSNVRQKLLFIDACRNDPVSGKSESINPLTQAYKRGFSFEITNREVEAFATFFATSIGDRAYETKDAETNEVRGYFSLAVVQALSGKAANEKGEVTLLSLKKYIEENVPREVAADLGKRQKPSANIIGYKEEDLVIALAGKTRACAEEWRAIENSNRESDFKNFLMRCGNSEYIEVAESRLKRVSEPVVRTEAPKRNGVSEPVVKAGTTKRNGIEKMKNLLIKMKDRRDE